MAKLVQIERVVKSEFNARVVEMSKKRSGSHHEPQLPLERLSKLRADRIAIEETPIPECTTCGICCFLPSIVPVTRIESERLAGYIDILLDGCDKEIVVDRVLQRAEDGRCAYLNGTIGESVGCGIYEERPHPCRDFEVGSDRCHEYRRMFGFEEQLTDTQVETAHKLIEQRKKPELIEDVSIISTGKIERTSYNVANGTVEYTIAEQLAIVVFLSDEEPHELHSFETGRENWFESDFLGLSIDGAMQLINEQAEW